jgi:hypothetical protein
MSGFSRRGLAFPGIIAREMLLIVSSLGRAALRGSLFLSSAAAHLLAASGALLNFNQFSAKGLIFYHQPIILCFKGFDNYC